jgi:hypothetical protein
VDKYSFTARPARSGSTLFHSENRPALVGIGLDEACIHRKALTADQPSLDTGGNNALEHPTKNIVIAEAFVARTREHRVVRDLVLKAEPAEPTIGQVDLHFATQRALRAHREGVTYDQHPDHQHRINRWPPQSGVVRCQLGMDPRQVQHSRNPPDLMIIRNGLLEVEAIEQLPLVPNEPHHHRSISQKAASPRPNHDSAVAAKRLLQQNRPEADVFRWAYL